MELEKAIIVATQYFRFWKYEWVKLSSDNKLVGNYIPNSDDIAEAYERLSDDAFAVARKSRGKGEAETGRLLVTCVINEGSPCFEYYIAAN
jgi:hypothetical protein